MKTARSMKSRCVGFLGSCAAASVQTFEEIPREEHCGIINVLAGMAGRWIAVTMGQLGQGGGHHVANRHK